MIDDMTKEQLIALVKEERARSDRWKELAKKRLPAPKGADGERLLLGEKVEVHGKPGWIVSVHVWEDLPHQVVVKRRNGVMGTWDASIISHAPETVEDVLFELIEQAAEDEDHEALVNAFSKRLALVGAE